MGGGGGMVQKWNHPWQNLIASAQVQVPNFEGVSGVAVTPLSNLSILGGWVTKVLKNGDKKWVGDNNILTFLSYCTR